MIRETKWVAVTVVFCFILSGSALADDDDDAVMNAEIDYLMESVANSGCIFIRNGKEHEAVDAVDHLAMKRKRGKRYYDDTDTFVERIASSSSWSGDPYLIRCGDEEEREIEGWYLEKLEEFRKQQQ